jgi:hypothetical protein
MVAGGGLKSGPGALAVAVLAGRRVGARGSRSTPGRFVRDRLAEGYASACLEQDTPPPLPLGLQLASGMLLPWRPGFLRQEPVPQIGMPFIIP